MKKSLRAAVVKSISKSRTALNSKSYRIKQEITPLFFPRGHGNSHILKEAFKIYNWFTIRELRVCTENVKKSLLLLFCKLSEEQTIKTCFAIDLQSLGKIFLESDDKQCFTFCLFLFAFYVFQRHAYLPRLKDKMLDYPKDKHI